MDGVRESGGKVWWGAPGAPEKGDRGLGRRKYKGEGRAWMGRGKRLAKTRTGVRLERGV